MKFSTPLRLKMFDYQVVIIDEPKDIQKLIWSGKSSLYDPMPYNNGLFSIKGCI